MVASHKNPFCRVLVSILNSKNLPQKLSVVIGDRWIEFPIRVESIVPEVKSYVETSTDQGDKDGNNGADDMTDGDDRLGGAKMIPRVAGMWQIKIAIPVPVWTCLRGL